MQSSPNTVIFSGYAKVPRNAPNYSQIQEIGCVIEVDMDTQVIVNCEFGRVWSLTNDFLRRLIVGYALHKGMEPLYDEIEKRCNLIFKNALIKCLEVCYQKFVDYKSKF